MPQDFSFDIVSKTDLQEVDNAVNQAIKEIGTRFDFKGSKCTIEFVKGKEPLIKITADDDLKLRNVQDILKTRMVARRISVKALDFKDPEKAFEGTLRQEVNLQQGIPMDKAKDIVRRIKDLKLKVQAAIQDDQVRVSSRSKDELQAVMTSLRQASLDIAVQFINFR